MHQIGVARMRLSGHRILTGDGDVASLATGPAGAVSRCALWYSAVQVKVWPIGPALAFVFWIDIWPCFDPHRKAENNKVGPLLL